MFLASLWSFSHIRSVFQDRIIHFGETLGDQVKGRSPKKLKSLIEVPYVSHLKVQVLSFNMNNVFSPQDVHRLSYPFEKKNWDIYQVKGPLTFKQKSLIEVPYVLKWKNMFLSYLRSVFLDWVVHFVKNFIYFRGSLVDQVKGRSPKKLKLFIEVPNEAHLKVHILSYNMILMSSP